MYKFMYKGGINKMQAKQGINTPKKGGQTKSMHYITNDLKTTITHKGR